MKLKIMVKETKEERRELTIEEIGLIRLIDSKDVDIIIQERAKQKLPNYFIGSWSYCGRYPEVFGLFRTETTREATPFEYDSWSILNKHEYYIRLTGSSCYTDNDEIESAKRHLAGKEIIPEVVEG